MSVLQLLRRSARNDLLEGACLAEAMAADSLDGGRFSTWLRVCRPGLEEYCRFPVNRLVFNYAHMHTHTRTLHLVSCIRNDAGGTNHLAPGTDGPLTTQRLHPAQAPESSGMRSQYLPLVVWLRGGEGKGKELSENITICYD